MLKEARLEEPEDEISTEYETTDWMQLANLRPDFCDDEPEANSLRIDDTYDWVSNRNNYSEAVLAESIKFIEYQKKLQLAEGIDGMLEFKYVVLGSSDFAMQYQISKHIRRHRI
jgi:hypothetical protein